MENKRPARFFWVLVRIQKKYSNWKKTQTRCITMDLEVFMVIWYKYCWLTTQSMKSSHEHCQIILLSTEDSSAGQCRPVQARMVCCYHSRALLQWRSQNSLIVRRNTCTPKIPHCTIHIDIYTYCNSLPF